MAWMEKVNSEKSKTKGVKSKSKSALNEHSEEL